MALQEGNYFSGGGRRQQASLLAQAAVLGWGWGGKGVHGGGTWCKNAAFPGTQTACGQGAFQPALRVGQTQSSSRIMLPCACRSLDMSLGSEMKGCVDFLQHSNGGRFGVKTKFL